MESPRGGAGSINLIRKSLSFPRKKTFIPPIRSIKKNLPLPITRRLSLPIRKILGVPEPVERHLELQSRKTITRRISLPKRTLGVRIRRYISHPIKRKITRRISLPKRRTLGVRIRRYISHSIRRTLGVRIRTHISLPNEVAFSPPTTLPTKLGGSVYNNVSQGRIVPRPQ